MKTRSSLSIAGMARKLGLLAIGVVVLGATIARADTLNARQSLVDLIGQADVIIHGEVVEMTDGIENGVPFTQVKIRVKEALRGTVGAEYTFRQFGLLAPRKMGNGFVNLNVTPIGWSNYALNEEVVLFLWPQARKTGLRTTVGLKQGKFALKAGSALNGDENIGLFDVAVDSRLLNDIDKRVLATRKGAVNADAFVSLVRRAVKDQWIEKKEMRNATK